MTFLFTIIMFYSLTNLKMSDMDYEDILPEGIEVIDAMQIISDEFGGTQSALIVIEISPTFPNSNEPKEVIDPIVIRYIDVLTQKSKYVDYVKEVSSISEIIKQANNGYLPNSLSEIKNSLIILLLIIMLIKTIVCL